MSVRNIPGAIDRLKRDERGLACIRDHHQGEELWSRFLNPCKPTFIFSDTSFLRLAALKTCYTLRVHGPPKFIVTTESSSNAASFFASSISITSRSQLNPFNAQHPTNLLRWSRFRLTSFPYRKVKPDEPTLPFYHLVNVQYRRSLFLS